MTPLRTTLALMLVTVGVLLAAGCAGPGGEAKSAGNATVFPTTVPVMQSPALSNNPTITPSTITKMPEFSQQPIALPKSFRPNNSLGSFEDSFIGSYDCAEGSETFETNFTLITGSGGRSNVKYTLVPVSYIGNLTEVPLSHDILNTTIEPDEFVAEPSHIYSSRFHVTISPNVTGESGTIGNAVYMRNPSYTFLLKVSVDGADQTDLADQVNVIKWCYIHSQTRNMQGSPSFENIPSEISMHAGERKEINLSFRNFGGGIRELQYKIPTGIKGLGFSFPLESDPNQLVPIPEGMNFSFDPPVIIGRNFQVYSDILVISTRPSTPSGVYHFPLEICYRNLDLSDTGSDHFPFSRDIYCPGSGSFQVTVESG